jgi:hypothetical protein
LTGGTKATISKLAKLKQQQSWQPGGKPCCLSASEKKALSRQGESAFEIFETRERERQHISVIPRNEQRVRQDLLGKELEGPLSTTKAVWNAFENRAAFVCCGAGEILKILLLLPGRTTHTLPGALLTYTQLGMRFLDDWIFFPSDFVKFNIINANHEN